MIKCLPSNETMIKYRRQDVRPSSTAKDRLTSYADGPRYDAVVHAVADGQPTAAPERPSADDGGAAARWTDTTAEWCPWGYGDLRELRSKHIERDKIHFQSATMVHLLSADPPDVTTDRPLSTIAYISIGDCVITSFLLIFLNRQQVPSLFIDMT